jgi:hypothetical protein
MLSFLFIILLILSRDDCPFTERILLIINRPIRMKIDDFILKIDLKKNIKIVLIDENTGIYINI